MWFDVSAALGAIEARGDAIPPVSVPTITPPAKVAEVAEVAARQHEILGRDAASRAEAAILAAIHAGNHRPGVIATATGLGATVAYQFLDRMQAAGLVRVARDGGISVRGSQLNTDQEHQGLNPALAPGNS